MKGKRVAFSAYGSIVKLNGQPLESARIVAKCIDSEEEATLDVDGKFRVRGLKPNTKYTLSVFSDLIDRTLPNTLTVEMKNKDSLGNQFLAIVKSQSIDVSGSVEFEGEDLFAFKEDPKAIVEIFDAGNLNQAVQTQQLTISRYFQFNQLPRSKYVLRVTPKRGSSDRRYEATTYEVSQEGVFQKLVVNQKSKGHQNFNRSALLAPVLFGLIVLGLLYKEQISKWIGLEQNSESKVVKEKARSSSSSGSQKHKKK